MPMPKLKANQTQSAPKRLEDYQPGASRRQVPQALSKVAKSPKPNGNGKTSQVELEQMKKEIVKQAIKIVIEQNMEAFKELERY